MVMTIQKRIELIDLIRKYPSLEKISCAATCGFKILPRIRRSLLKIRKDVTYSELLQHVCGYKYIPNLYQIITSEKEKASVFEACYMFRIAFLRCRGIGRPESKKLAWIIPGKILDCRAQIIAEKELVDSLRTELIPWASQVQYWLPWISLEIVRLVRNWRRPKLKALNRAIFKLASEDDGLIGTCYPLQVLYQYEPTNSHEDALQAIINNGVYSVNHLKFLHPEAINCAKHRDNPLLAFYQKMNQALDFPRV